MNLELTQNVNETKMTKTRHSSSSSAATTRMVMVSWDKHSSSCSTVHKRKATEIGDVVRSNVLCEMSSQSSTVPTSAPSAAAPNTVSPSKQKKKSVRWTGLSRWMSEENESTSSHCMPLKPVRTCDDSPSSSSSLSLSSSKSSQMSQVSADSLRRIVSSEPLPSHATHFDDRTRRTVVTTQSLPPIDDVNDIASSSYDNCKLVKDDNDDNGDDHDDDDDDGLDSDCTYDCATTDDHFIIDVDMTKSDLVVQSRLNNDVPTLDF